VYIDKESGWPLQVIFEGRLPAQIEQKRTELEIDPTGRTRDRKLTKPAGKASKIILKYTNVNFQPDLGGDPFAFTPAKDVAVNDETDGLVSQLEGALAAIANKKKAEAAKGAPVLDGSVSAPSPTGAVPDGAAKLPGDAPK
jgi:hypothetical protein